LSSEKLAAVLWKNIDGASKRVEDFRENMTTIFLNYLAKKISKSKYLNRRNCPPRVGTILWRANHQSRQVSQSDWHCLYPEVYVKNPCI